MTHLRAKYLLGTLAVMAQLSARGVGACGAELVHVGSLPDMKVSDSPCERRSQ